MNENTLAQEKSIKKDENFFNPNLVVALFFFCGITLFSSVLIILASLDRIFSFCSYSITMIGEVIPSCEPNFYVFEILAKIYFNIIMASMWGFFISIPIFCILIWWYVNSLNTISKNLLMAKERKMGGSGWLLFFKIILIILPFLLILQWLIVSEATDSYFNKKRLSGESKINELVLLREQKFADIASKNPDFCKDAPDGFILIPNKKKYHPALYLPTGYLKGTGVVYLSRENTWDGVVTSKDWSDLYTFTTSVVDFSSSQEILFDSETSLGNFAQGNKYDVRFFTLTPNARFDRGFIDTESVSSSTLLINENCFTITYR